MLGSISLDSTNEMTWQQLVETGKNRKGLVKTRIRPSFFKKNILAQVMTKTMTIICKQLMCDSFYLVQKKSFILKFNVAISVLCSVCNPEEAVSYSENLVNTFC
jgi:hypothetical protein